MSSCGSSSGFAFDCTGRSCDSVGNLRSLISQSHLRVTDLQRETEQEIIRVRQQLRSVRLQQKILTCELPSQDILQTEAEHLPQRAVNTETCNCFSGNKCELPRCIVGKAAHFERLRFREQALVTLLSMLGEDIQRYRQESTRLDHLTDKLTNGMPGKSQLDTSMGTDSKDSLHILEHSDELLNRHIEEHTNMDDEEKNWRANKKASLAKGTNLTRSGSVKDLIHKFSVSDGDVLTAPNGSPTLVVKNNSAQVNAGVENMTERQTQSPVPDVTVTPPSGQSEKSGNAGSVLLLNGPDFEYDREKDRPPSVDEPTTPRIIPSNPKYQLYLGADRIGNGASGPGGPIGTGLNGTISKTSITRRSMESLAFRDFDSSLDKIESPARVFNSPYSTVSVEYNPVSRLSEYKVSERLSPATSEINLFGLNRSTSPVSMPTLQAPRSRFSAYDTLTRRREQQQAPPTQLLMRNNLPNKRDYIEELTKQLEDCQRRNQFLEAESIELEKERTQIRFQMRGLMVNNEDLLRMNTQLQGEMNRMRERIVELESNNNVMVERFKQMEVELKEAREVMVEANTQEYAFNFLQQSLKNKIQDAEEALEKQTLHAQTLSEKLWLAERNLEELELEKDTKGKKAMELGTTLNKLETELAEALQQAAQANTELGLQQKLRMDAQLRVEELEESVLEKDQEVLRLQQIVNRLQGEVSDKLLEKEHSLEEEIQLREKMQLQWKQAERTVEDLQMELQTVTQARDDLTKQVKQAQEKLIDLETDVEEMQENEQRWASKNKKVLEQCEQLQLKLIQEKDLNDKLECEKVILERQIRELNSEIEEMQNNKVHEHVITKAETRAKELENALRAEERSKVALNNTISKLERKISELTEQLDEEHRISNEHKDLMTQRMRSLKRQLNEAEEQTSRRESQYRHTQRELTEEREASARLQKQLLDIQLLMKRKDSIMVRQTLDNLKLDLSVDEEDEPEPTQTSSVQN
ncbi:myosin-6-like isoform X1 [Astyanax mexicanus]|uniref:Myosin-6-like isoform X1 n=1 Tax=Astyanax mexicanus TaxID=7994 RepID=A0A8T2L2G0_ASTMX|nr:myosin-6-like isoform X1 [Astyanax mexicanus]